MTPFSLNTCARFLGAVLFTAALLPLGASAQSGQPELEIVDEVEVPEVTIRSTPQKEEKIIERREGGEVKSITVKSGNSTYQLKPNKPAGSAQRGDIQSDDTRPAQWKVREFDWETDQKKREAAAKRAAERANAPPLPPPSLPEGSDPGAAGQP